MEQTYNYAGFWRRFLAESIDGAIMVLFGIGLSFSLGGNWFDSDTQSSLQQIINSLMNFVFPALYSIYFWVHHEGATPGKKLLAIKIIKTNGSKLDYGTAIVREFSYFVSLVALGLGYFWVIWDKNKQGWHDKIAGTYVVKTDKNPRMSLAIILSLLFYLIFFGSTFAVGIDEELKTGNFNKEIQKNVIDARPAQSIKQNKDNMSAEAKVHYDKSQALFQQMRAISNNPEAIKPIADQTIREAKLATEVEPNNPFLWSNLGYAYGWPNTLGTTDDSLNAYKKAEELDPSNVVYINLVGDQLIGMNRNGDAILQFQKTLRLSNTSGYAYVSIGKAYKNLKVYNEAIKHLQRGIEIFQSKNKNGKFDKEILEAQKELAGIPK